MFTFSLTCTVHVYYSGDSFLCFVGIILGPMSANVTLGSSHVFSCTAVGGNDLTITWTINGTYWDDNAVDDCPPLSDNLQCHSNLTVLIDTLGTIPISCVVFPGSKRQEALLWIQEAGTCMLYT